MSLKSANRTMGMMVATALVAAMVVVPSFLAFQQVKESAASRRQTFETIIRAESLMIALSDAETSQRGYVVTGDEVFLGPYQAVRDGIPGQLESLKQTTHLPRAQQHLVALSPLVDAKLAELSQVIELRRKHDLPAAAAMVSGGAGRRLMEAIRAELNDFVQFEKNSVEQIEGQFQVEMGRLLAVILVASLSLLMVALLFTYYWRRQAKQRIENLLHIETKQLLEAQEATNTQLQVANDTLHASEENLAVTLNSIGDAVIATDADARVTSLNIVAEKLTGWARADAAGRPVSDVFNIINQETRKSAAIPVMETLAQGTVQGLANHTLLIARDGSECAIADSCAPIRARDGRVIGAVLVFRNVSDEYATQQALRDSAVLMQTVLHSVGDGIITLRAHDGIVETVNPAVERMFAHAASDLIGKHLSLLLPSHGPGLIEQALAKNPVSDESQADNEVMEVMGRRKDGADFHLEITLREMWLGGKRYFTGVLRDVTTRKETEEALLKAGALQRAIFNSANFSSIATDAKGVIQIFNVGAERMLGYSAAEVMNTITPADISDPKEVIARAKTLSLELSTQIEPGFEALVFKASRGIEDIYELTYIRKDGSRFPAIVSVTALRDPENDIIGYLLIGTDNTARKQAEEELLRAGALQSAIFNSANFSSIATDAKGVIQIFNVGAERMLGYSAEAVMNKVTPADISDPKEVIARAKTLSLELSTQIEPGFEALVFKASRGIEDIYELTYIRKDGSRFPAIVSVTALRDPENEIIGYLLIGTDNTARKQAEEELLRAGALQSAIFNSANFSSIATDANGVIQIFNVGAERMLGYTADEVMNKITPAAISDSKEVIARAQALSKELSTQIEPGFEALVFKASRGIEDIYELTYIRKDGSRFPAIVSVTALRDPQNEIIGYLLIGTDNTARKQIELAQEELAQRLRDQQFYTRSLFESNIDALITTDPSGVITDANKQMEVLTGCKRDELIGGSFKNFFTDPERADAGIKLALKDKTVTNYELTANSRDGKETVVSYNAATFYDRDRKLQGVYAAARDITDAKYMDHVMQEKNVELECARAAAEKANLAKSDFLSSMSHELRSPLNAILGFAQLLDSDSPPVTNNQKASVSQILHAGWYLLELINEILDLTVIESGKLSLSAEPVSLGEVMTDCQAMIEPQGKKRGIHMAFPEFNQPVFVHADRIRLKQVLINLLSNAIKYNRAGGDVIVDCAVTTAGHTRISVRDTGQGLSPEKMRQLFQPFNRLGQESSGVEGTGIGLVMSKLLVELMGGKIGVESKVGVGSVFWYELNTVDAPQLVNEKSQAKASSQETEPTANRVHTLLYVEDNPANLALVEQLIARRSDMQLLTAVTGPLGVDLAREKRPDVILMDINLPGFSGIQAMKMLREDASTAFIPVIAISANAMQSDIKVGMDAGFFRYITKPIKVDQFMEALDTALDFASKNNQGQ